MKIKIIYGSDTGNTEEMVTVIKEKLTFAEVDVTKVSDLTEDDWNNDNFILGIPTWYDGELQSDWEHYFDTFQKLDFTGKTVAIFGLGDQYGYEEWFCDGVGILAKVVLKNGGRMIGYTKKDDSYDFDMKPKLMLDDETLYGLALDEDNQDEMSYDRIDKWLEQIKNEI